MLARAPRTVCVAFCEYSCHGMGEGEDQHSEGGGMQRRRLVRVWIFAIAVSFAAAPSFAAQQPPGPTCTAVTKQEYDSAKKQYLLQTRFSRYVRTGRVGQRQYWYCNS